MESLPLVGGAPGPRAQERAGLDARREPLGVFRREVERAIERDGGRAAVAERAAAEREARRAERRAGFAQHRAEDAPRPRVRPGVERTDPERAGSRRAAAEEEGPALPLERATPSAEAPAQAAPAGSAPPSDVPEADAGAVRLAASQPAPAQATAAASPTTAAAAPGAAAPAGEAAASPPAALDPRPLPRPTAPAPAPAGAAPAADAEAAARVLDQLRARLDGEVRHVSLELQPAELGRIALHLVLRRGKLTAIVRAESAHTLGLVERQLPELQASLAQQGIEAERFELHQGFADGRGGRSGAGGAPARLLAAPGAPSTTTTTDPRTAAPLARAGAAGSAQGVDTYA